MNETQKRIKAYKDALPGLRERVAGVALLLVMSLVMMTSASFAWLTLSKSPEVSSAATTVTANGNLEIALSNPEGEEPEESKVGDSAATTGQSVVNANLTWGNLVNLSDTSYGLENLMLRPAMLGNATDLLNRPLVTINYGQDGRAEASYNYELAFTNWDASMGDFGYSSGSNYGVRAISTIAYDIPDSVYTKYSALLQKYDRALNEASQVYQNVILTQENVDLLGALIADYMEQEAQNGDNADFTISAGDMQALCTMMEDLLSAYLKAGEALANVINVEYFNYYGADNYASHLITESGLWTYNEDGSRAGANTALFANIAKPASYDQYITDVPVLEACIDGMRAYYNAGTETWSSAQWLDVDDIINKLAQINSCEVVLKDGTIINVRATGTLVSNLSKLEEGVDAYIKQGIIVNFEALTGSYMDKSTVIEASVSFYSVTAQAESIRTEAHPSRDGLHTLTDDINTHYSVAKLGDGNARVMAQDTYGMAIDFWVRTNAPESCLVLEGNVLTERREEEAVIKLADGKEEKLYRAVVTYEEVDEEGNPITEEVDVYYLDPDGEKEDPNDPTDDIAYFADTFGPVWTTDENDNPVLTRDGAESIEISADPKMNVYYDVVGYEGENRVWDDTDWADADKLTVNSTTQGNGSCYVFYSDNAADQHNSLELLSNFRVAFLSEEGVLMAKGRLNTERYYADSGKVTVPLELFTDTTTNNTVMTEDEDGNPVIAIAELTQNEPMRLTMIVYLEGSELTNEQVLAAGEIDGRLNVQFGTSVALVAMGDDALEKEELTVTADIGGTTEFTYGEDPDAVVEVCLTVDGVNPNTVTGFFTRKISETQGSREDLMIFTQHTAAISDTALGSRSIRVAERTAPDGSDDTVWYWSNMVIDGDSERNQKMSVFFRESETEGKWIVSTWDKESASIVDLYCAGKDADGLEIWRRATTDNPATEYTTDFIRNGDADSGKWWATYVFDAAGNYVFRSAEIDGQERELDQFELPTVTVHGVTVEEITCASTGYLLTGEASHTTALTMTLSSGADDSTFDSVQLQFVNDDTGATVTTGMTYNGKEWQGNARFLKSGSYTLTYVILDGQPTELERYRHKLQLVLGVKVLLTDDQTETDRQYVYKGESFKVELEAKLYDGNDKELKNIGAVQLNYSKAGSSVNTLYSAMTWDADEQSYVGDFQLSEAGVYAFHDLTITVDDTDSFITSTINETPVYTVVPPDPPAFVRDETTPYQLLTGNVGSSAEFTVLLSNASGLTAANVAATMVSEDRPGEPTTVFSSERGEDVTENGQTYASFIFTVPSDSYGQDGRWQITSLACSNVYDQTLNNGQGGFTSDTEPFVIDLSSENVTTVVQTPTLSIVGSSQWYGGTDKTFGSTVTTDADEMITITVKDKLGNALDEANAKVTGVSANYTWEPKSDQNYTEVTVNNEKKEYGGGYTTNRADPVINITMPFTEVDGGAVNGAYVQDGSITLTMAGKYDCTVIDVTIEVGGSELRYHYYTGSRAENTSGVIDVSEKYVGNMPKYYFRTEKPTVTITAISNQNTAISVDADGTVTSFSDTVTSVKNGTGWWGTVQYYRFTWHTHEKHVTATPVISDDNLTADVYFQCFHAGPVGGTYSGGEKETSAQNERYHAYSDNGVAYNPRVTITLANISNFTNAKLNFSDESKIYSGTTTTQVDWVLVAYTNREIETQSSNLSAYSWTSAGACERIIGYSWNKESRGDDVAIATGTKGPAGEITASTLTVVYSDGNTYTFTIPTITINNPY